MYNQLLERLPESLQDIQFGNAFNHPITLARGLKRAVFGRNFSQDLGTLPSTLSVIELGQCYKHPMVLPESITACKFGKWFDEVVNFPPHLKVLELGPYQRLPETLPASLEVIYIKRSYKYEQELQSKVPPGCEVVERN